MTLWDAKSTYLYVGHCCFSHSNGSYHDVLQNHQGRSCIIWWEWNINQIGYQIHSSWQQRGNTIMKKNIKIYFFLYTPDRPLKIASPILTKQLVPQGVKRWQTDLQKSNHQFWQKMPIWNRTTMEIIMKKKSEIFFWRKMPIWNRTTMGIIME